MLSLENIIYISRTLPDPPSEGGRWEIMIYSSDKKDNRSLPYLVRAIESSSKDRQKSAFSQRMHLFLTQITHILHADEPICEKELLSLLVFIDI